VTMRFGSKVPCRWSMASAQAVRVSRGGSDDTGRAVGVHRVVELRVVLDLVGSEPCMEPGPIPDAEGDG
jgi:hypothetical protein